MQFAVLAIIAFLLTGCGPVERLTMTPEERINAAAPPAGTETAMGRLAALLDEHDQPQGAVMAQWQDQLRARVLRCAAAYKPGLFDSDADIRTALTDKACFQDADKALLGWLHWRIAGLLLAAPALRPLPPELPVALGVQDHILNAVFAADAGVAVLHTGDKLILVDLKSGEPLAEHPANAFRNIGKLSPNGRLLAAGTVNHTSLIDVMSGDVLLDLATTEASNLHWLDAQTAITGQPRGTGSMLLDFSSGRTVPIPWMYRGVTKVMALPDQKDTFGLAYSGGISRMKLERTGTEVRAIPLGELPVEGQNNFWQGSFSADGKYFVCTLPEVHVVDMQSLTLSKQSFYPLGPGLFEVAGPGPDEFLISASPARGNTMTLVYRPAEQTVRIARDIDLQRGDYFYVQSLKTLAKKEKNRIVRIDQLATGEPMSFLDLSMAALEGRFDTPAPASSGRYPASATSGSLPGAPALRTRATATTPWVEAIGIYQGSSIPGAPANVIVEVRASAKTDRVLLLSSYEAVTWRVFGPGAASLKAIYVASYKQSSVTGTPDSVPIKVLGSAYAYKRNDAAYQRLENSLIAELGKGIDSFQGTYEGQRFTVGP